MGEFIIHSVYIALGSNKGDRLNFIRAALHEIDNCTSCKIKLTAGVYETKPYGSVEQQNFYNSAALITTSLSMKELLSSLKALEVKIGRTASQQWGPREIDIDILFYDNLIYSDEQLTVPHKEVHLRDFVLQPLADINADFIHPALNKRIATLLAESGCSNILNKITGKIL